MKTKEAYGFFVLGMIFTAGFIILFLIILDIFFNILLLSGFWDWIFGGLVSIGLIIFSLLSFKGGLKECA